MASRYLREVEWQILHAINLYIFRNGKDGEQPILVHIPPEKKKNMKSLMKAIQDRVKFPIGYATQLYNMEGQRVKLISELEQYHCYVAASNYDKHFICIQYGRKRSPLLVLNRDSKHIRYNIRTDNHERMLKKKFIGEDIPECIFYSNKFKTNNNSMDQEIPDTAKKQSTCKLDLQSSQRSIRNAEELQPGIRPMTDRSAINKIIADEGVSSKKVQQESGRETLRSRNFNDGKDSWTIREEPITISGSDIYNRKWEDNSPKNSCDSLGSQERLNRRYLEIFKQAKTGVWKSLENLEDVDSTDSSSYSTLADPSNNSLPPIESCSSWRSNRNEIFVLPPPPLEFQDDSFLPEINNSCNNISPKKHHQSEIVRTPPLNRGIKLLADPPFILLEGQLRPQLRRAQLANEVSRRICEMLHGNDSFGSYSSFQSFCVSSRRKTARPVSSQNRTQNEGLRSFKVGRSFCKTNLRSSPQFEKEQPSFETFVIHDRGAPHRTINVLESGILLPQDKQKTSYPNNIMKLSHTNFFTSPTPNPSKAKFISRNGYLSS